MKPVGDKISIKAKIGTEDYALWEDPGSRFYKMEEQVEEIIWKKFCFEVLNSTLK